MSEIKKINLFGLGVSIFNKDELIYYFITSVEEKQKIVLYGHGLCSFKLIQTCPEIVTVGNEADILVTDGRLFYLLCKLYRLPIKYDISIPESVNLLLNIANQHKWGVYLLGASENSNEIACKNVLNKYKQIPFCEGHHGYFPTEETQNVIDIVNQSKPVILLIGMLSPQKEIIAINWKSKIDANIIIPCGGMIDVLSGKTKITPKWLKKAGFASIWRVVQEPKRLLIPNLFIYSFIFFKLLPILFWQVLICRNKTFTIQQYFRIK